VYIVPKELVVFQRDEAYNLAKNIDVDDVLFFATALVFKNSIIWTDDKNLKSQDRIKVFNTQEIMKLFKK